jgi:hypothetical protein
MVAINCPRIKESSTMSPSLVCHIYLIFRMSEDKSIMVSRVVLNS